MSATIADGRPRTASFVDDSQGQVLSRTESAAAAQNPMQLYSYFNGMRIGDNGKSDTDYATALGSVT